MGRSHFARRCKPPTGIDDRVIGTKDLVPAGFAVDVKTAPGLTVSGHSTDIALLLGSDRLWLFDVTNPRSPQAYPSRPFAEMGLTVGAARRLDVDGTLAYVMFSDRIVVIDFSNPAHPFVTAVITGLGNDLRWVSVEDGFVYTIDTAGNGGVTTTRLRSSIGSAAAVRTFTAGRFSLYQSGADRRADDHMTQAVRISQDLRHDAPRLRR